MRSKNSDYFERAPMTAARRPLALLLGWAMAVLVLFSTVSCSREQPRTVLLPLTPTLRTLEAYAVVDIPYQRVHAAPDPAAPIIYPLRHADLLRIVSQSPDRVWLEIEVVAESPPLGGWVLAQYVRQFPNGIQALAYADTVRNRWR